MAVDRDALPPAKLVPERDPKIIERAGTNGRHHKALERTAGSKGCRPVARKRRPLQDNIGGTQVSAFIEMRNHMGRGWRARGLLPVEKAGDETGVREIEIEIGLTDGTAAAHKLSLQINGS